MFLIVFWGKGLPPVCAYEGLDAINLSQTVGDKGPCGWVKCRCVCWYVTIRGYEVGPACLDTWEWQRCPGKMCIHLHETAGGAGSWGNWESGLTAEETPEPGQAPILCVPMHEVTRGKRLFGTSWVDQEPKDRS